MDYHAHVSVIFGEICADVHVDKGKKFFENEPSTLKSCSFEIRLA